MKTFKKIILIDLDGVLNEYTGNFDKDVIPECKKGAEEFLEKLSQNYEIKIFTTRNRLQASKWLIENKLDNFVTDVTNVKEPASIYIDDRALNFNGDFNKTLKEIETFNVYWK